LLEFLGKIFERRYLERKLVIARLRKTSVGEGIVRSVGGGPKWKRDL
jgi:hypothetical protein